MTPTPFAYELKHWAIGEQVDGVGEERMVTTCDALIRKSPISKVLSFGAIEVSWSVRSARSASSRKMKNKDSADTLL